MNNTTLFSDNRKETVLRIQCISFFEFGTITWKLKAIIFYELANTVNTSTQRITIKVVQHQYHSFWPLLSIWNFLVLFCYPCTKALKFALQVAWDFSGCTISVRMYVNIIAESTQLFFLKIYNMNILQTRYCGIWTDIVITMTWSLKWIKNLYFAFDFDRILLY